LKGSGQRRSVKGGGVEFSEATELLLAAIYESNKKAPGAQLDAGAIAQTLALGDDTVVKDAVWALDERGLVAAVFAAGSPQCAITEEGSAFVENGGSTAIIRKYQADPQQYIKPIAPPAPPAAPAAAGAPAPTTPPPPPAVPAQPAKPLNRPVVEEKLAAMRRLLQKDVNLSEPEKIDAICDLDTLKAHFGRQRPDKFLVEPLLARLESIESLGAAVREFTPLVRDSF
jgi:hypothetical protein